MKHSHYHKNVEHLKSIDVYRVLELFGVCDPALQHAIKKLLVVGGRGPKDRETDIREAIDSLNRLLQMVAEDCNKGYDSGVHKCKTCEAMIGASYTWCGDCGLGPGSPNLQNA